MMFSESRGQVLQSPWDSVFAKPDNRHMKYRKTVRLI